MFDQNCHHRKAPLTPKRCRFTCIRLAEIRKPNKIKLEHQNSPVWVPGVSPPHRTCWKPFGTREYTICADKDVYIRGSANLFMVQYPDLHLLRLCTHSPDVPVTQAYARITWKPW